MKSIIINRNDDINTLFEIIDKREDYKENSENGLVILLNGSWGSGKTTFIKELEQTIKKNNKYKLLTTYNSYDYDFFDNAYLPFFADIEDKIKLGDDFGKLIRSTNKNLFNGLVCTSYTVINSIFKKKYNIDLNEIKDNLLGIENEEYLKSFYDFKECQNNIKKIIKNKCKRKPNIFIIDELDRCKPSFAMETLEIVKHFFDIKNCIFIIAVDKIQLQESAKTIYGQEMNSEVYFSKFFDYQYNLLPLKFSEIIDTTNIEDLEQIVNRSSLIFDYLGVSLRDSKKIFSEFIGKYRLFQEQEIIWTGDQSVFIVFLLTLKYVDLTFYKEIINGNYNRHYKKITNEINPLSNNYNKLLSIKIGNKKDFNSVCSFLSNGALNIEYQNEKRISTYEFEDDNLRISKDISKEMINYIPFIEEHKTIKETIEKIVN